MREDLKDLKLYQAPPKELTNLANNENYLLNWQEIMQDELIQILMNANLNEYGDSQHSELMMEYAKYLDILPANIVASCGSDSIIPMLVNVLITKKVITVAPDFFRYAQATKVMERQSVQIEIKDGYIDEIIKTANEDNDIEMILLSNPNNPLGIVHKQEDLIKILNETNCYVVIDEAYQEFAEETLMSQINNYPKLIILRTLSKAFALANLRVGFAIANEELAQFLRQCLGPFTLSDLNANIATHAIKNAKIVLNKVEEIKKMRTDFQKLLDDNGIEHFDSKANFIYIVDDNIAKLNEMLLAKNYAAAVFLPDKMRISLATPKDMEIIKEIFIDFAKGVK